MIASSSNRDANNIGKNSSSGVSQAQVELQKNAVRVPFEECVKRDYIWCFLGNLTEENGNRHSVAPSSNPDTSSNNQVPLMNLNVTKAGMEGLDVESINKIISEASQGSKFYEHKKKQQEKLDERITNIKQQLILINSEKFVKAEKEVNSMVSTIKNQLDYTRYFLHIDMDAFYASVEMRDDPSLRNIPMAVGGESMLSTSNYQARRFGVRAAMPGFIARKLCPQLKIIPCNFEKYISASNTVKNILKSYDDQLSMCMDEADLDITEQVELIYSANSNSTLNTDKDTVAFELVKEILAKIKAETKLTSSAGLAPTRLLAKICSDMKKPYGICFLKRSKEAVVSFLSSLPIRKVCGIGAVMEQQLKAIDIHTCGDLWDKRITLQILFKKATYEFLLSVSMGCGGIMHREFGAESSDRKSISCERTFSGTADLEFLDDLLKKLCRELEQELQEKDLVCKAVAVKIKTARFEVKTRNRNLLLWTNSKQNIFHTAWSVFMTFYNESPDFMIRLLGVRVSTLMKANEAASSATQTTIKNFFSVKEDSVNPDEEFEDVPDIDFEMPTAQDAEMDPIAPSANFTETKTTHQAEEMKYNEKGPDLQVEVDVKHPDVIHTLDDREGLSFNTDNHSVVPGFAERDAHSRHIEGSSCSDIKVPSEFSVAADAEVRKQTFPHKGQCPVCDLCLTASTYLDLVSRLDTHIEECLSKRTIREIRNEELSTSSNSKKRSSTTRTTSNSSKKIKRSSEKPIDSFFKK